MRVCELVHICLKSHELGNVMKWKQVNEMKTEELSLATCSHRLRWKELSTGLAL